MFSMTSNKSRIIKNVICSILIVLIFLMSFIILINLFCNFVYVETRVRGFSMQPTINSNVLDSNAEGDTIYINQYAPFSNDDVVVAQVNWPGIDGYIIKRLVGKPGDKVQIKDEDTHYGVYVNNSLLYTKEKFGENDLFHRTGTVGYFANYQDFLSNPKFQNYVASENGETFIKLGEDDYFLMGDNWGHTTDSIAKGPLKFADIIGKVDLIVDSTDNNPYKIFWFSLKKIFS